MITRITKFALLLTCLTSCTDTLYVNVLEPANDPLPSHIKNVLIGVVTDSIPKVEEKIALSSCVYHLNGNLSMTPRYHVVNPDQELLIFNKNLTIGDSISLKDYIAQYNTDGAILITDIDVQNNIGKNEHLVTNEDIYGNITISKSYSYSALIHLKATFTAIDNTGESRVAAFKANHIEQLESFNPISNEQLGTGYDLLAYKLVQDYVLKICPKWKQISREYFSTGNDKFIAASAYIKQDKIDDAILIWKELTKSEGDKTKGRACYNMAIASEIKGSYTMAFDWLNKAKRLGCNKASEYEVELQKQFEISKKLDQQFGY